MKSKRITGHRGVRLQSTKEDSGISSGGASRLVTQAQRLRQRASKEASHGAGTHKPAEPLRLLAPHCAETVSMSEDESIQGFGSCPGP